MAVISIGIGRYRSLYDVEFRPGSFTVLVGPNNSGKTNLVEAVEFLADAYRYGLETAVTRKGGIENIAFRRMRRTKSPVEFRVTLTVTSEEASPYYIERPRPKRVPNDGARFHVTHTFALAALSQAIEAPFRIARESIEIVAESSRLKRPLISVRRDESKHLVVETPKHRPPKWALEALWPFNEQRFLDRIESSLQPTALLLGAGGAINNVLLAFAREMGSARLYQLSPIEARRSGVPTPNAELERYGENLPAFVNQLRKSSRSQWGRLIEAMRSVVPGLDDIQTSFSPDRRLTLEFKERGVGRPWTAEEVSDGTIQSLALFAVLQRQSSRLVLIEEPENSVHPWIVRQFVDACRAVTPATQIVLTTHSPALIAYLEPEEIMVVWRDSGRTKVAPLTSIDPELMTMWQRGELSSFDILDTGIVREAVPGGTA